MYSWQAHQEQPYNPLTANVTNHSVLLWAKGFWAIGAQPTPTKPGKHHEDGRKCIVIDVGSVAVQIRTCTVRVDLAHTL